MRKDRISFSEALRLPVSQLFWGIGDREYGEGGRIPAGLPHLSFKVSVLCLSLTPTFSSFASPLQPIPHSSPLYKSFPYNLCFSTSTHSLLNLALTLALPSATSRDLTDISLLRSYIHLRYVDVSENHLTDLSPLNYLTHLLWLKADGNRLRSAQLDELPYLQIASFAYNQITDTEGISHPRLGSLDLKGNRIRMVTGLDPQKLNSLHTLELRGNQLDSTLGINLPKLKNLFLAQNMLKKVEGLENLSNLTTLHLRDNQIETLSGFSGEMKSLQYLNLRGNMVTDLGELAKLRDLPKLRALVLLENPCTDESDYRQEALVQMAHLERLDKDFYEEEERAEADEIRQRLKEDQEHQAEPDHEEDLDQSTNQQQF
nr:leucine-rich repeat-containing protein 23 isoform X1 [Loxodonta africana]